MFREAHTTRLLRPGDIVKNSIFRNPWRLARNKSEMWCEALSFGIGSGGQHWKTGGSSTLCGLGPFGPVVLPLEVGSGAQTFSGP